MISEFGLEIWIKYAVAICVMALRFFVRWIMVGPRNFDSTDFFCVLSTILYTILSTCDYLLGTPDFPTNIGLTPETAMKVPDEAIPAIVTGTKLALFSWTMYITMLFAFKAVLLCMYRKLSMGIRHQEKIVMGAIVFTFLCFVASILVHLCSCLPMKRIWQVKPFPGDECTIRPQNYYIVATIHIITDVVILLIPMPLLFKLQIPKRRKIVLGVLFSAGIFTITCAILRMIYSLSDFADMSVAQSWAGREGFVAMIVVSAPGIWPLLRKSKLFESKHSRGGSGYPQNSNNSKSNRASRRVSQYLHSQNKTAGVVSQVDGYEFEMAGRQGRELSCDGSQDGIVKYDNESNEKKDITITQEYTVAHEESQLEFTHAISSPSFDPVRPAQ